MALTDWCGAAADLSPISWALVCGGPGSPGFGAEKRAITRGFTLIAPLRGLKTNA
jgi:hypothetical protein